MVDVSVADRVDVHEEGVARVEPVAVLAQPGAHAEREPFLRGREHEPRLDAARRALLQPPPDLDQRSDARRVGGGPGRGVRDRGIDEQHHVGQEDCRQHELDDRERAGVGQRKAGERRDQSRHHGPEEDVERAGERGEGAAHPARRAGPAPPHPQQPGARRIVICGEHDSGACARPGLRRRDVGGAPARHQEARDVVAARDVAVGGDAHEQQDQHAQGRGGGGRDQRPGHGERRVQRVRQVPGGAHADLLHVGGAPVRVQLGGDELGRAPVSLAAGQAGAEGNDALDGVEHGARILSARRDYDFGPMKLSSISTPSRRAMEMVR